MGKRTLIFMTLLLSFSVTAISSKNPNVFRSTRFRRLGSKIKEKSSYFTNSIPDVISLKKIVPIESKSDEGEDNVPVGVDRDKKSISLLLSEVKERTGDLQQMVSTYSMRYSTSLKLSKGDKTNLIPRGGSIENNSILDTWIDRAARTLCIYSCGIVSMQTVGTIISTNEFAIFNEIADRLLSKESATAVKTIRKIINDFPDHGVVDIFSLYSAKELVAAILALSRLQRAAMYATENNIMNDDDDEEYISSIDLLSAALGFKNNDDFNNDEEIYEKSLLADLAHYSIYAHCAYGWKFGLLSGKLHLGDKAMLKKKIGIEKQHILCESWKSKTHLPAYFIVRDENRKKIVLTIRGTLSAKDVLTDLCAIKEEFLTHEEEMQDMLNQTSITSDILRKTFRPKYESSAHQGMLQSSRGVAKATRKIIATELSAREDYDLVIVGHSLGGGVAAILGSIWKDTFPGLQVYAFGCPCVGPENAYPYKSDSIISVVGEGDPFSCLSLGHLADASIVLSKLCEDKALRESILNRTALDLDELDKGDLKWCVQKLAELEKKMTREKFFPPGRVLYVKGNLLGDVEEVSLTEINQAKMFRMLRIHPRMFDLSLHIPHRYEVLLSRVLDKFR